MTKRILVILLLLLGMCSIAPVPAFADWTYGTAKFYGDRPSNSLNHGGVIIYYNGTIKQTGTSGNTELWECTGDVCIIYPKDYNGNQIRFTKSAGVQVQYLK